VRFGLPASEAEWTRFEESLREAMQALDTARAG
jgi:cobalamin biosynthetic protein CobC